ncbi:unnamed protein product, partial [Schistosoma turkestanicum]
MLKNLTNLFIQNLFIQPKITNYYYYPAGLHTTAFIMAEPLKRKKRVDPALEQIRIGRKVRKIEKEIKRFSRFDRILRPIEEIEGNRQLKKEL